MQFSTRRLWGIILRHLYNFRRNLDRVVDTFYWPALDIVIWGLTISALQKQGQTTFIQVAMILTGTIMWYIIWRGQGEIAVNLLEEFWSENLVNLMSTPLTVVEWVIGIFTISLGKMILTVVFTGALAYFMYLVNITVLGWILIPMVISLLLTGWTFGLLMAGLFLRHGTSIQTLAWAGGFILMPFSGTYYPLSTLPQWVQNVAVFIPSSYIFEGMRQILLTNTVPSDMLLKSFALNAVYFVLASWFFVKSFEGAREKGLAHLK